MIGNRAQGGPDRNHVREGVRGSDVLKGASGDALADQDDNGLLRGASGQDDFTFSGGVNVAADLETRWTRCS